MSKKVVGALLLLVLSVIVVVVAWLLLPMLQDRHQSHTSDAAKASEKIRIGVDNWIGYFPLCSQEMKSAMHQAGYILICEDDRADYAERMQRLKNGELDFAVATVDSYLLNAKAHGFPATIVSVIDESKGGDAILTREKNVNSLDDFKGRNDLRVAFTPSSPSHYLLKAAADHFNVPELLPSAGSHRIETAGSEQARDKLFTGAADVAVLWEPDVSKALEQEGVKKVLGTEDTQRLIVDILLVNREYSQKSPKVVKLLLSTYFSILKKYRSDEKLLRKHVKKQTKLTDQQITVMLSGVHWASFNENCEQWFGIGVPGAETEESLVETLESTAAVLISAGDFSTTPIPNNNPYRLTNSSFLEELFTQGMGGFSVPANNTVLKESKDSLEARFTPLDDKGWQKLKEIGTLRIDPIIFQSGSTQLTLIAKQVVDNTIARLKHYPHFRVIVRGHTGTRGDTTANEQLSQQRAEAVARYMTITYSIDQNRLYTEGVGGSMPLEKKSGESDRAYQYRLPRVELILVREEI
ncbi:phosphate ABC transporter substrate-binding/OmpA family protein [Desulfogranum japonicum]|uniref:phosphate ABC transporter substrate-binding/OmpA family protein n=1 Tax=Desulfogranum japonicum TaxID=231447 RepID=UPI000403371E|nr:phosphate ABC transporter substrate-binding/OmpA family protein [Desulfogranum japonicum]